MISKKKNIMSMAMDEDMQNALKREARDRGYSSVSAFLRDLVERFALNKVTVIEHETEAIPVVLKIPINLRDNREGLREWMNIKADAIVKALS